MGLDSLWNYFATSLPVLKDAWVTVVGLMLAASVLGWALGRHSGNERLASMQGRLDLANDRIAAFDRKLSGASPDEASKLIESLERRLAAMEPKVLTAAQLAAARSILTSAPAFVQVTKDAAAGNRHQLNTQLLNLFAETGWSVTGGVAIGVGNPPRSGIAVMYTDVGAQSAALIARALEAAGLPFELRQQALAPHQPPVDVLLTAPMP